MTLKTELRVDNKKSRKGGYRGFLGLISFSTILPLNIHTSIQEMAKLTWLWTVTTAEDKAIIEHTARGVQSHYFVPGPIAPMEQNELRYINWYLDEISRA